MELLNLLIIIPAISALVCAFIPTQYQRAIRVTGLTGAAASLAVAAGIVALFDASAPGMQQQTNISWIPALGINFHTGIDGLTVFLVPFAALIWLGAVIFSAKDNPRLKEYFFWLGILQSAIFGFIISLDIFLFFVFWQLTAVPLYFLTGINGGEKAAVKYFRNSVIAGMLFVAAIAVIYINSLPHTLDITLLSPGKILGADKQLWIFLLVFVATAIRMPLFPFHSWAGEFFAATPSPVAAIHAALISNAGIYAIARFLGPITPEALKITAPLIMGLAAFSSIYGPSLAISAANFRSAVAWCAMGFSGFLLMGIFSLTQTGITGAMLGIAGYGAITASLFLLAGINENRFPQGNAFPPQGGFSAVPVLSSMFILALLALAAVPALSGFTVFFLCMMGTISFYPLSAAAAVVAMAVIFSFALKNIERLSWGKYEKQETVSDILPHESVSMLPLILIVVLLGMYPSPFINWLKPAAKTLANILR